MAYFVDDVRSRKWTILLLLLLREGEKISWGLNLFICFCAMCVSFVLVLVLLVVVVFLFRVGCETQADDRCPQPSYRGCESHGSPRTSSSSCQHFYSDVALFFLF